MCVRSNIGNKGRRATAIIMFFKIQNGEINITRNMIKINVYKMKVNIK